MWLRHFSSTFEVHRQDCEGWWLSSCPAVTAQWQSTGCTSQVSWVWFLATASLFTFLNFGIKDSWDGHPTSFCYFSKMPQVRTLHARLCSDLGYAYSNQSSCVLVGHTAPFSVTMKDFSKLLTTFVSSRVTNLVLATCHACMACVQWPDTSLVKHNSSTPQYSRTPTVFYMYILLVDSDILLCAMKSSKQAVCCSFRLAWQELILSLAFMTHNRTFWYCVPLNSHKPTSAENEFERLGRGGVCPLPRWRTIKTLRTTIARPILNLQQLQLHTVAVV